MYKFCAHTTPVSPQPPPHEDTPIRICYTPRNDTIVQSFFKSFSASSPPPPRKDSNERTFCEFCVPARAVSPLLRDGRSATVISRVGDDELGREVMRRLKGRGLSTDCIQVDTGAIPTGFVVVTMAGSMPSYDIVQPSAWDAMEPTEQLVSAAKVSLFLLSYGQL